MGNLSEPSYVPRPDGPLARNALRRLVPSVCPNRCTGATITTPDGLTVVVCIFCAEDVVVAIPGTEVEL